MSYYVHIAEMYRSLGAVDCVIDMWPSVTEDALGVEEVGARTMDSESGPKSPLMFSCPQTVSTTSLAASPWSSNPGRWLFVRGLGILWDKRLRSIIGLV